MEVFNKPPSIGEDTLQYTIHPPQDASDKASATALATCISTLASSILQNFIWNRDAYEVKVVPNVEKSGSWILEGRMRVGDCVDDEWCTIWLLKEISAKWDVVIGAFDSDGEFLLIEAAEALPSWITPTNSENRVWIHRSRLHLIPLIHTSPRSTQRHRRKLPGLPESDDEGLEDDADEVFLSATDAVRLVRDVQIDTFAPLPVERLVWQRISGYPAALKDHVHQTKAYVPEDIFKALLGDPSLIQRAVETFYTRDALQLRTAHRMTRFPPNTSVLASVRMTRTAYAQLSGQKFFPPKLFGQWKDLEGSNEWRWKDLGMKIAVGFEMLYQESKGRRATQNMTSEGVSSSATHKGALQRDSEYQQYLKTLESVDYFKGEKQGSALWNQLENKAVSIYTNIRRADGALRPPFAAQVDSAISSCTTLPSVLDQGEDSDQWLQVDAADFDQMLEETFRKGKGSEKIPEPMGIDTEQNAEDRMTSEQAKRLKNLASKVEDFVEGEGDLEGARFEDDVLSDEPFSDEDEDTSDSDNEVRKVSVESTRTVEQQAAMDKLVPALDPNEYGKMPPSFHSNSQRVVSATVQSGVDDDSTTSKPVHQTQAKEALRSRPIRAPIIPRDKYDGVDSDDETDPEDEIDEESEDEKPQVVGDIEIDMGEEEEEFLEFSRQALGITDDQWAGIIKDRQERGAFLPPSATSPSKKTSKSTAPKAATQPPQPPNVDSTAMANQDLNSFEAVMNALDAVLAQNKTTTSSQPPQSRSTSTTKPAMESRPDKGKSKQMASIEEVATDDDVDDEGFDVDAAMEAELKSALQVDDGNENTQNPDYNLIMNFLESFKSQSGLSGPVSSLSGVLAPDLKFPRDNS